MNSYDKNDIKAKLDEHVKHILEKPSISNEDYALLREKLSEIPTQNGFAMDMMWAMLIMMISGFGGGRKNEL